MIKGADSSAEGGTIRTGFMRSALSIAPSAAVDRVRCSPIDKMLPTITDRFQTPSSLFRRKSQIFDVEENEPVEMKIDLEKEAAN
jgi:hypothetical protein